MESTILQEIKVHIERLPFKKRQLKVQEQNTLAAHRLMGQTTLSNMTVLQYAFKQMHSNLNHSKVCPYKSRYFCSLNSTVNMEYSRPLKVKIESSEPTDISML